MINGKDCAGVIDDLLYFPKRRKKVIDEIKLSEGNDTKKKLTLISNLLETIGDIPLRSACYVFEEQRDRRLLHLPIPMGSYFYHLVHVCEVDCPYCADPECDDAPANMVEKEKLSLGTLMFLEGWGKYSFATREEAEESLKGEAR